MVDNLINEAMNRRCVLSLTYNGETREVEPRVYGIDTKGHLSLLAWQISGRSDWRHFHADKILALELTTKHFVGNRGNGSSSKFSQVFNYVN